MTKRTMVMALLALLAGGAGCGGGDDDGGGGGGGGDDADAGGGGGGGGDVDATPTADAAPACDSPGTQACASDTLEVCTDDGELVTQTCDLGCLGDECNDCNPSTVECVGDDIVTCDASGDVTDSVACLLGCQAGPECATLEPTNLPETTCDTAAASDLTVSANQTFNTDDGPCDLVVDQTGPDICVVRRNQVTIDAGVTLRVVGSRALALVATADMVVNGTIDASADGTQEGPGATVLGLGQAGAVDADGGGGGGHRSMGGDGGTGPLQGADGGAGGAQHGVAILTPLHGGSRGGFAGGDVEDQAQGGGGGGALQLVACGTLTIAGTIDTGGGGGEGGRGVFIEDAREAGAGGGSGGAILLEAAVISLSGTLAANGGGGGGAGVVGSDETRGQDGQPGEDANASATPAAGGFGPFESGDGGDGGAEGSAPQPGEAPTFSIGSSGGGGGAAGRIRLNVRDGASPNTTGVVSPAASTGAVATH